MAFNLQSFLQSAKKKAQQAASFIQSAPSPTQFFAQKAAPVIKRATPTALRNLASTFLPAPVRPFIPPVVRQLEQASQQPSFGAPGTWTIPGTNIRLPDVGLTENLPTTSPIFQNPLIPTALTPEKEREYWRAGVVSPVPEGQPPPSPAPSPISAPSGVPSGVPTPTGEEAPTAPPIDPEQAKEEFIKAIVEQVNERLQPYIDRTGLNPFAFDEAWAKELELQRFAPYYTQTIQQFLRGVQAQAGATGRGTQNLLQELGFGTEQFTGRSRRLLELAQEQARTGFAERGLLFSGERGRAEGELAAERERQLQNFLRGQAFKETGALEKRRNILEELSLEKEQRERELQQKQSEDVSAGIETARQRAFSGARELEAVGPAPGENYQDFLGRRAKTYRSFIYGPSV